MITVARGWSVAETIDRFPADPKVLAEHRLLARLATAAGAQWGDGDRISLGCVRLAQPTSAGPGWTAR